MAEGARVDADKRDEPADGRADLHLREQAFRLFDDLLEVVLVGEEVAPQAGAVQAPMRVALHDAHPLVDILETGDVDAEPESVEQLRAEVSFLGLHRPDEDESRRVRERDPLALHRVPPHRRRIEEHVDDVIVEEIHLVHVEDAPVGVAVGAPVRAAALAELDGGLGVDGADDAILRSVDRQFHDPHPPLLHHRRQAVREASAAVLYHVAGAAGSSR